MYWFNRFNAFYTRANTATRDYRFDHVDLITRVYTQIITVMGEDIESVRQAAYDLIEMIQERSAVLGDDNACILGVVNSFDENSASIGAHIQSCALYANTTMSGLLTTTFYPTFVDIKDILATVPVAVVDALSRGNVLQDEQAIIEMLRARYEIIEFQWLRAVSQLLRWETNRFEIDGLFLVDETTICMAHAAVDYILNIAQLESQIIAC